MPEELAPGVYLEETSYRSRSIPGVPTWVWPLVGLFTVFVIARLLKHRGIVA